MQLNSPVANLNRVGKALAKHLNRLGVFTIDDLLHYYPFRYEDYRGVQVIKDLKEGMAVTVRAKIELIANRRSFKSRKIITEALVSDGSGSMRVIWFNQPYVIKNIKVGDNIFFSGAVKADMLGCQMISPSYERAPTVEATTHTARLVPMYYLTAGITQKQLRFIIKQALTEIKNIPDWLPAEFLEEYDLPPQYSAILGAHFPHDENNLQTSLNRLKFGELFLLRLKGELARMSRYREKAPSIKFKEKEIKEFVAQLPFSLTKGQKVSAWEILQDLEKNNPMNRLLSGDVGSGKTVVAAMGIYSSALSGWQSALIAPTEILAKQHFESLQKVLKNKLKIVLLTRSQFLSTEKEGITKKEVIEQIKAGETQVIVGTHAILSENIFFYKLGLAVVDEQHRFGVEQRKALKDKAKHGGLTAHFLSLTATPIPRSLALTLYGDLDLSVIDEMPLGRKAIMTRLVEQINRQKAYNFIREQVKKGRQVFVICPLISDGTENEPFMVMDILNEKKTVMKEYEKLSKNIFLDLRVGFLHGKMKAKEKDAAMEKFKRGETDVLVATAVVEVGVDIPNASVMMIEGAERFGLAQLHQFRGRVGRSVHQSYCFLFTSSVYGNASDRLKYFEKNLSGFKLAEKDLETRGPGEVYGTTQSGMMNLRLAKLTDLTLIKKARTAAAKVAPNLKQYPNIKDKVKIFLQKTHLE